MYNRLSQKEENRFLSEINVNIKKYGEKISGIEKAVFFKVTTQDKLTNALCFDVIRGESVDFNGKLVIRCIKLIENSIVKESRSLHKIICAEFIKKFINKAKLDKKKALVAYTDDIIIIETLFELKFGMAKLTTSYNDEIRAELSL